MINMRRIRFSFLLAVLVVGNLNSEQLTTVAVVDIDRVFTSFYRESQRLRDLDFLQKKYQQELDGYLAKLSALKETFSQIRDDPLLFEKKEQLKRDIATLTSYIDELTRQRKMKLQVKRKELMSDTFVRNLQKAIQYISKSEGYTIVFRADDVGLQWWASEVDISEKVIQYLFRLSND